MHSLQALAWKHKQVMIAGSVGVGLVSLIYKYALSGQKKSEEKQPTQPKQTPSNPSPLPNSTPNANSAAGKDSLQPVVKMETTLNIAKLSMGAPKGSAPNVVLVFCVDTSGSMEGERIDAVKRVLKKILKDAQEVVKISRETKISIVIFSFDIVIRKVVEQTKITSDDNQIAKIEYLIDTIECEGNTDLFGVLDEASEDLINIAVPQVSYTFILLTDGAATITFLDGVDKDKDQVDDETFDMARRLKILLKSQGVTLKRPDILPQFYQRLASVKAQFFCIGIGKECNKEALQKIVNGRPKNSFEGKYIDATNEANHAVEKAIEGIYKQSIALYREITLTTSNLKGNEWSVKKTKSFSQSTRIEYLLGDLQEGKELVKFIEIDATKLPVTLELKTVEFQLTFKDRQNKLCTIAVPWNPNTCINPVIIEEAKKA